MRNYDRGILAVGIAAGMEKTALNLAQLMTGVAGAGLGSHSGYDDYGSVGGAVGGGAGGGLGTLGGVTLGSLLANVGLGNTGMEAPRRPHGVASLLPLLMAATGGFSGSRIGAQAGHAAQERFQGE